MRIRIIGAGALGMLLTAKLAGAGACVELVVRSAEQAERLEKEGVRISGHTQTAFVRPVIIRGEDAVKTPDGEIDAIIVTVKQLHITPQFASFVSRQLTGGTIVACFQNGLGHIDTMSGHIPRERLLTAVTTEAALKLSACEVEHTGGGTTWLGFEEAGPAENRFEEMQKKLIGLLLKAGFRALASNNILYNVWHKLIVNSVINPLTAILRVRNGELLATPHSEALMRTLLREASELASAKGIEPPGPSWEQLAEVCVKTADNRSSMLQDILAGRPTEIDRITGSLLREAQLLGIQLPAHETVYVMVKALEAFPVDEVSQIL
ncbi:ketopantoate reductase family protein [Paenibacillus hamazuiensis]|uniref:ketopantoate reductase family protein n=1 Tax=Paenibacillus hamazuiensis TaxID=2936508 RepID=UPI00200DFF75|nr:2-dehydropantoate 2-reductase [Paenibacillus hamazuiensis]